MEINLKTQWNKLNSLFRVAIILFLFLFSQFTVIWSQTITFSENSLTIKKAFAEIEKQTDMSVDYDESVLNIHKKIELGTGNKNLDETLNQILQGTNCSYVIKNNHIVISAENKKQEKENLVVTGTITDEHGEPIIGANVMERGTTNGCISDIDGNYSLSVKGNSVLLFSYIGYISKEIAVNNQKMINVRLMEDTQKLEEVVVVGYGVQKKVNLTGAVSVVKGEEMTKRPVTNATSMLQGQVPGLRVVNGSGQSGNNKVSLRVRGQGTYSDAGSDPLVLINGVPGDLSNLDPNAIESISVLKDAASAAVYGARAANGVVLVTTKTGINKKTSISYSGNFAIYSPTRMLNVVTNSVDYMNLWNEAKANSGISSGLYPQDIIDQYKNAKPGDPEYPNYDWLGEHIHSTFSHNHNVAVSGGSDKMSYNVSMYYADENGTMDGHGYKKYNFTADLQSQITKWMKFGSYVGFMRGDRKRPYEGGTDGSFTSIFAQAPTYAPQRSDGSWVYKAYPWESNNKNVIALVGNDALRKNTSYDVNAQAWLTIDIVKGLSWHTKGAVRMIAEREKEWRPLVKLYNYHSGEYMNELDVGAKGLNSNDYHTFYTYLYSYLKYDVSTKDQNHNFGLQLGYSQETNDYDWLKGYRKDFPFPLTEIDAGSKELQEAEGNLEQWSLMGIFGRFNYNYLSKYLLEANLRYDGSSKFLPENRWDFFYGFSGGWRLTEENFMKNVKFLNELKLRLSYGVVGNQSGISRYDGRQLYNFNSVNGAYLGDGRVSYVKSNGEIATTGRSWERIHNYNLGVDFQLFNSRLQGTVELFMKKNNNMLIAVTYPGILGDKAPASNSGKFEAKGYEGTLTWSDKIGKVNYHIGGTFTYADNKLVDYGGVTVFKSGFIDKQQGYSLNSVFGLKYCGKIQTEEQLRKYKYQYYNGNGIGIPSDIRLGDNMYEDVNGDGVLDEKDYVYLGSDDPKISYSFNLGLEWNNFDFSAVFQGVAKRTIFRDSSNDNYRIPMKAAHLNSTTQSVGDVWSPENRGGRYPTYTNINSINDYNYQCSSWSVENGNYLRLKSVTLGYNFPTSLLNKIRVISRMRVYVSGNDLWEVSKINDGWDPEASRKVSGNGRFPFNRTCTVGLDLTF